ncbi:hypothetical protein D1007_47569 [Hordeum vulgare]|nr:hypothetical protein D1007_47569 [Hordeum vulgare]
MQYSQDLKEHLAEDKHITSTCMDEAAMALMRADPQILEEHLTIDASCSDAATRLAAINNYSWSFLKGIASAFDKDYHVFSMRARAYVIPRADKLVSG